MKVEVMKVNDEVYQVEITKTKAVVVKANNKAEAIKKAIKKDSKW